MDTLFGRVAREREFASAQKDLLVGSLLGDGTLLQTTSGYCFRVHHGLKQCAFVDWKYERLREFVRSAPRACGAGYYFRTVTHPYLTAIRPQFYVGRRKIVPAASVLNGLTPFSLAVWIMDDGARDGNTIRLNVQSFSLPEAHKLVMFFEKRFRLRASVNLDKGRPRLRFASSSAHALTALIYPHVIPEMRYKLPLQ